MTCGLGDQTTAIGPARDDHHPTRHPMPDPENPTAMTVADSERCQPRHRSRPVSGSRRVGPGATILLALGVASACAGGGTASVEVLAASSLTDAFEAMADEFEARTGEAVSVSTAGSATIRLQVVEGAPADVVALADEATMAELVTKRPPPSGAEPVVFATNHLVLVVARDNPAGVSGLDDLEGRLVAVCAPQVPCGRLAARLAGSAGVRLSPATEPASVRAVLAAVELGEVDAGLVYASDVSERVEVVDVPGASELVNRYPIVAFSARPEAQAFIEFVLSDSGSAILADHGFGAAP